MSTTQTDIKTRILFLSDTHGCQPQAKGFSPLSTKDEVSQGLKTRPVRCTTGYREPLPEADVVIHCGDLTLHSLPEEYRRTFSMLRAVKASLKLAIAGNHDQVLDREFWNEDGGDPKYVDEVESIITNAKKDNVRYLTEGNYTFNLENGAKLRIYVSQYTPEYGWWAFQYPESWNYDIKPGTDVVVTHGPPKGILDSVMMGGPYIKHAGCNYLLEAVQRVKPKVHCYGHIHEAWGAKLLTWKQNPTLYPTVDLEVQDVIEDDEPWTLELKDILPHRHDDEETTGKKIVKMVEMSEQHAAHVDLVDGDRHLSVGEQTLFLNAAIMSLRYNPTQLPWVVDVPLAPWDDIS